jgi:bacterioferritin (cytochrome b1)
MTIEELVDLLTLDLSNEYAHWHFYMQAATNVRGLHRQELSEFFLEQAASEMKHIEQFRRLITGLKTRRGIAGGVPSDVGSFKSGMTCPKALLEAALQMENDVVNNYVLRHSQAENIGSCDVDATYVALFLEDQILDSRGDADNILEMLENAID